MGVGIGAGGRVGVSGPGDESADGMSDEGSVVDKSVRMSFRSPSFVPPIDSSSIPSVCPLDVLFSFCECG